MTTEGANRRAAAFKAGSRRAVKLSTEELVERSYLCSEEKFPLLIRPAHEDANLVGWAQRNRAAIETDLLAHGAILFRDFQTHEAATFAQFVNTLTDELLEYHERAAPRSEVSKNIYTSTEYPAEHCIPLHHEMSYSHNWPTKLWFYCAQPAREGGQTPIASDRKVFELIDPAIKERFMKKKVMYVRNYGEGVDLTWQETFQTDDQAVVERYCRDSQTEFEWRSKDRLRTRQVRQAVAVHPRTGETVWFNHAHMFHVSNLEPATRASLLSEFKEDELPRNAFYGDGSSIESDVLEEIREIYSRAAVTFTWQKGDILMLDNFLASHGRESFVGPRRVLVAMAELFTNRD